MPFVVKPRRGIRIGLDVYPLVVTLVLFLGRVRSDHLWASDNAQQSSCAGKKAHLLSTLPEDDLLRLALEAGEIGNGKPEKWMREMQNLHLRRADLEFKFLSGSSVTVFAFQRATYSHSISISPFPKDDDPSAIRRSGLETVLREVAIEKLQNRFKTSSKEGSAWVTLFDDPCLPALIYSPSDYSAREEK